MSDTDSFLQEVSEELRRDKLYRNIRKYGWVAILLVILIVGAATYREYLKSQAETEAELFGTSIIDALNEKNVADRIAKLQIIYHANVGLIPYCLILFFDLLCSPLVLGSACIIHAKKEEVARVVHKISS